MFLKSVTGSKIKNSPCPKCHKTDVERTKSDGTYVFFCKSCQRFFQPTPDFWTKVVVKGLTEYER